jgi:hypothetical protein
MRTVAAVGLATLLGLVAPRARAAEAGVVQPYDAPEVAAPAGPAAPAPSTKVAPRLPPRPPQAGDGEVPSPWQPPRVDAQPRPRRAHLGAPSDAGLVVAESLLGLVAATGTVAIAVEGSGWLILAGPLATGGLVCAIGSSSNSYDGSCAAAVGGAYLGSLLTFPLAYAVAGGKSIGEANATVVVASALLGYVVGSTVGGVVGWNASRTRKDDTAVDVAALDAAAAARAAPWREPLLPRGAVRDAGPPRLTSPVLAFRF